MQKAITSILIILFFSISAYTQWEDKSISADNSVIAVDFINEEKGFVVARNSIYKTDNGGDAWDLVHIDKDLVFYEDIFVIDTEQIIAVGFCFEDNESIITKSIDGGATWTNIENSFRSRITSVFFSSSNIGYCANTDATVFKTVDSGNNWVELNTGTDYWLHSVHFVTDDIGIAVGGFPSMKTGILKTQDGGSTWEDIDSPTDSYLQSVYFADQETVYAVGWNGGIIKSDDSGTNWTLQNSVDMLGNMKITFTDINTGYIVGGGINQSLIQKTYNGGELWEDISPDIDHSLIGIDFPSYNVGYAVGDRGTIIKTNNGGISSTNNLQWKSQATIYPNPTTGVINIEAVDQQIIEAIKVYDGTGRLIQSAKLNSQDSSIDLSNLKPNNYYIQLDFGDSSSIKKVVKY